MSTLRILNYFLKVATMRGFSNISVTSSLGDFPNFGEPQRENYLSYNNSVCVIHFDIQLCFNLLQKQKNFFFDA